MRHTLHHTGSSTMPSSITTSVLIKNIVSYRMQRLDRVRLAQEVTGESHVAFSHPRLIYLRYWRLIYILGFKLLFLSYIRSVHSNTVVTNLCHGTAVMPPLEHPSITRYDLQYRRKKCRRGIGVPQIRV